MWSSQSGKFKHDVVDFIETRFNLKKIQDNIIWNFFNNETTIFLIDPGQLELTR
jgi:hypothetical protein